MPIGGPTTGPRFFEIQERLNMGRLENGVVLSVKGEEADI
jgi:hypothetical protein